MSNDPAPVNTTQYPNKPCDPRAIHDKYPPIGTTIPKAPLITPPPKDSP